MLPTLHPLPMDIGPLQIERATCTGANSQKWDITQESDTGVTTLTSVFSKKYWDNFEAPLGGRTKQYSCIYGSRNNKKYYLEFQGYVTNCGGAASQKVRTSSVADKSHSHSLRLFSANKALLLHSGEFFDEEYTVSRKCFHDVNHGNVVIHDNSSPADLLVMAMMALTGSVRIRHIKHLNDTADLIDPGISSAHCMRTCNSCVEIMMLLNAHYQYITH
jgi:hypothetical protein